MQNYYFKFLNMCKFAHDRKTLTKIFKKLEQLKTLFILMFFILVPV